MREPAVSVLVHQDDPDVVQQSRQERVFELRNTQALGDHP